MLLANYASDSGSDSESEAGPSKQSKVSATNAAAGAKAPVKLAAKKGKGPVKITLDLPKPSAAERRSGDDEDDEVESRSRNADDERVAKKPKIQGKGSSALLGMLPPPKRKLPVKTDAKSILAVNKSMAAKPPPPPGMEDLDLSNFNGAGDEDDVPSNSGLLLPSSMARAKAKAKTKEEPAVDLFGLGGASTPVTESYSSKSSSIPTAIVSAPSVPDFVPPEPTANDPYPGYYQLPSGQWAAYDQEFYNSFFQPAAEEKVDDGRVGKHWDEYTRGADVVDVDVAKGLQEGRAEQERLESLKKPKTGDEFEYKASVEKTKGLAAQRHQLTSLLSTAYSQRQELEDRIAQNSKNMRVARQKYGF